MASSMTVHVLLLLVLLCTIAKTFRELHSLQGLLLCDQQRCTNGFHHLQSMDGKQTLEAQRSQQQQRQDVVKVNAARSRNDTEHSHDDYYKIPLVQSVSNNVTKTITRKKSEQNFAMLRGNLHDARNQIAQLEAKVSELQHAVHNLTTDRGNRHDLQSSPLSQLPTCQQIMQRPNSPFADGSFITRHTTPYTWIPRPDGSRQLQLTSICTLKRYTSAQARQCLANRHVAFIGDSLTKYQYISLLHFLELGNYPPRFGRHVHEGNCTHIDADGNPTCSIGPNICMEGDWNYGENSWVGIHSALGGGGPHDDGGLFHGRSECSCARDDYTGPNSTENFRYVSDEIDGTNGKRIKLTYLKEIGWDDNPSNIQWYTFTNCSYTASCRRTLEHGEAFIRRAKVGDWDWEEPLEVALQSSFLQSFPDVDIAIYNRGLWGILKEHRAKTIMPLLHAWAKGENGRCFFKSTTASYRSTPDVIEYERGAIRDVTLNAGCGYLDFAHITDEFRSLPLPEPTTPKQENGTIWVHREREDVYWDTVHFVPWVYEELNNVMLNVLCNNAKPFI